jgi:hypothetical protein
MSERIEQFSRQGAKGVDQLRYSSTTTRGKIAMSTQYSLSIALRKGDAVIDRRAFSSDTPFNAFSIGHAFEWSETVVYRIADVRRYVGPLRVQTEEGELLPEISGILHDSVAITLDADQPM